SRQISNEGSYIDVSLFESSLSWQYLSFFQPDNMRSELLLNGGAACYNIYQCSDGYFISIAALESHFWTNFCDAVNKAEWVDAQYETIPQRQLISEVAELFKQYPRKYWNKLFKDVDCCYEALLLNKEMSFHPQIAAREAITQDGPAYPAHINDKTVALNIDIFEFKAGEKPEWTSPAQ
ncbi:MAG TPA: hypothetical protein EYG35_01295, partial [Gammaproteobacteria bacterium]|nr:hypothetical protein [Gammaproteobacteria bacterium]